MSLTIRRVVTGHDKNGHAIVSIDENVKNVAQTRPGAEAAVVWTSEGFPAKHRCGMLAGGRPDCVAGHVRLELRNVGANYPFE
jgi:hypothetical protein